MAPHDQVASPNFAAGANAPVTSLVLLRKQNTWSVMAAGSRRDRFGRCLFLSTSHPMKILTVDDSRFLRMANERALVRNGHVVITRPMAKRACGRHASASPTWSFWI